eukprot:1156532-Pelagomonas_calceolata.AAC.12
MKTCVLPEVAYREHSQGIPCCAKQALKKLGGQLWVIEVQQQHVQLDLRQAKARLSITVQISEAIAAAAAAY